MATPRRSWAHVIGAGFVVTLAAGCVRDQGAELRTEIRARIAQSGHEVGYFFLDLVTNDTVAFNPDLRMHAASMVKVPVMIQLFRDAEAGRLNLDSAIRVKNEFRSIVDGSPYQLTALDDSDSTLYGRAGGTATIRELTELMITVSSNLATNILIELVGAERVTQTMRELGADSIQVLRGVEDTKAYEQGLSNTTTARDLGVIFGAIASYRAASGESCEEMIGILVRQQFNDKIPRGIRNAPIAHKTGDITGIHHDGGIVFRDDGGRYALVVLTRGFENEADANKLIEDLARITHRHATDGGIER